MLVHCLWLELNASNLKSPATGRFPKESRDAKMEIPGKTCAVLLADVGGGASDASAVRCDTAYDRNAAAFGKLTTDRKPVTEIRP